MIELGGSCNLTLLDDLDTFVVDDGVCTCLFEMELFVVISDGGLSKGWSMRGDVAVLQW